MKSIHLFRKGFFIAAILLFFFSCSKNNNSSPGGTANGTYVYMAGSVFSNTNLSVAIGAKVTWVNNDNMVHTVTADDGSFNSGDMAVGDSFSYVFNTRGSYTYHCIHHSAMTGAILVGIIR